MRFLRGRNLTLIEAGSMDGGTVEGRRGSAQSLKAELWEVKR